MKRHKLEAGKILIALLLHHAGAARYYMLLLLTVALEPETKLFRLPGNVVVVATMSNRR